MGLLRKQSLAISVLCALWGAGIMAGFCVLTTYTTTPAQVMHMPNHWPQHTTIARASHRPTLLLALHPRCVCSRATIEELARLLAQAPAPPHVTILLYTPENAPDSWGDTDVVIRARSLPGVTIRPDIKGRESEQFRLSVSGQAAMYDPEGHLLFTGGITSARGHEGDNAGRDSLISILAKHQPATSSSPVFGCAIRSEL